MMDSVPLNDLAAAAAARTAVPPPPPHPGSPPPPPAFHSPSGGAALPSAGLQDRADAATVLVQGLPAATHSAAALNDAVHQFFGLCGTVETVRVDGSQAWVQFQSPNAVQGAVKVTSVLGAPVVVTSAAPLASGASAASTAASASLASTSVSAMMPATPPPHPPAAGAGAGTGAGAGAGADAEAGGDGSAGAPALPTSPSTVAVGSFLGNAYVMLKRTGKKTVHVAKQVPPTVVRLNKQHKISERTGHAVGSARRSVGSAMSAVGTRAMSVTAIKKGVTKMKGWSSSVGSAWKGVMAVAKKRIQEAERRDAELAAVAKADAAMPGSGAGAAGAAGASGAAGIAAADAPAVFQPSGTAFPPRGAGAASAMLASPIVPRHSDDEFDDSEAGDVTV